MSSWQPEMSRQRAKNHVFFEVMFSHIRRQICSCTHFTFCNKYVYMQSQCRFIIGVDWFINGYWVFCGGNVAQGPDVNHPHPFEHWGSVWVQLYLYLPSLPAWHFIWQPLHFSYIRDRGDFALRNQLLWTSYFSFRKLCGSIDAGVGRLKYVTHDDTSIFLHINHIFTIIDRLIFCNFMFHLKYLGSYIFSRDRLHLYIFQHFLQSSY